MSAEGMTELLWASVSKDVVLVHWPEHAIEAQELDRLGLPHLLLVEPDATTPDVHSCVQDWVRLPASESDIRGRLSTLQRRALRHPSVPTVDEYGKLTYNGTDIYLSQIDQRLVELLARHFEDIVPEHELLATWPGDATHSTLRIHVSRLRKQLEPAGLSITSLRRRGYAMRRRSSPAPIT